MIGLVSFGPSLVRWDSQNVCVCTHDFKVKLAIYSDVEYMTAECVSVCVYISYVVHDAPLKKDEFGQRFLEKGQIKENSEA